MTTKFLSGSVTQGSADAFATAAIATGLGAVNVGFRVRLIEWVWPTPPEVDSAIYFQITRRQPTALLGITDRRLLLFDTISRGITTSGTFQLQMTNRVFFPKDLELLIVEDPIYFSVDSDTTSASNSISARVYYEEVRLTDTQKLAALNESANA